MVAATAGSHGCTNFPERGSPGAIQSPGPSARPTVQTGHHSAGLKRRRTHWRGQGEGDWRCRGTFPTRGGSEVVHTPPPLSPRQGKKVAAGSKPRPDPPGLLFVIMRCAAERGFAQPFFGASFFGMYRSVMVPSNTSLAIATDSDKVGCGWMVWAMSPTSQPISIASAISAISSPA